MSRTQSSALTVHETERQRQYVRLQIPLSIEIGSRRCELIDWSVGGFAMTQDDLLLVVGRSYSGHIILLFSDFEMDVKVHFEVCYRNEHSRRIGCRLIDQTPGQLSILQYMVRAHVAGEIVHMNDVINVIQRAEPPVRDVPKPTPREAAHHRLGRWLIGGALSLLFAVMLVVLGAAVYERLFVIDARSAVVTTDLVQIAAPQGGRVAFGPHVQSGSTPPGGLLATITTPGGSTYFVESPCECIIVDVLTAEDSQVGVGVNLMLLAPTDAAARISALVTYADALRLREGMRVMLSYPATGASESGTIRKIDMRRQLSVIGQPLMDPGAVISSEVVIDPDTEVPIAWIGRPVAVTIDTLEPFWAPLREGDAE